MPSIFEMISILLIAARLELSVSYVQFLCEEEFPYYLALKKKAGCYRVLRTDRALTAPTTIYL